MRIAGHFGQDGGGGNGDRERVAVHNRAVRDQKRGGLGRAHERHGIGKDEFGSRVEPQHGADHSLPRCLVHVQGINLSRRKGNYLESKGLFSDL